MRTRATLDHLLTRRYVIALMRNPTSLPKRAAGPTNQHGTTLSMDTTRKVGASLPTTPPDQPRVSHLTNDSYCVASVYITQPTRSKETLEQCLTLNVNSLVADHVPFVVGHPQQKGLSHVIGKSTE